MIKEMRKLEKLVMHASQKSKLLLTLISAMKRKAKAKPKALASKPKEAWM